MAASTLAHNTWYVQPTILRCSLMAHSLKAYTLHSSYALTNQYKVFTKVNSSKNKNKDTLNSLLK